MPYRCWLTCRAPWRGESLRMQSHTLWAISASQKQTRWQSGLFIWDIEHGREATVTTCNSALAGCADAARWQEAVYFTCGLDSKKLQPDVVSYNTSLSACTKSLNWQYPLLLLSVLMMLRPQPTTISYNSTISACEGLGEWMQAVHLLETAEGCRLQPSVITFSAAISACAVGKKWQEAVFLLGKCAEQMPPDVVAYNASLNACEKAGQWSAALALLSELCNNHHIAGSVPDVISYNSTISVCCPRCEVGTGSVPSSSHACAKTTAQHDHVQLSLCSNCCFGSFRDI